MSRMPDNEREPSRVRFAKPLSYPEQAFAPATAMTTLNDG